MDLIEILRRSEGKTLEFKRDLSGPLGVVKTIVAFANTAGGTLLLGVEDGSRHVRGVRDALGLEERVANLISDRITPRLLPEIEILPWRQTHVLAVQVHPSPGRPHWLSREGPLGGVYVRVGSTNRRADAELVDELRRFARGDGFDEQPMPGLDSEAIDFRAASESFADVRKLARRDLETLRLITDHQGRHVPTVGGMLLFGKDRERHFPDAWIQTGRFDGTDKRRIVDRAEIRSLAVRSVEEAITFVNKHVLYGAEIGPVRRKDSDRYKSANCAQTRPVFYGFLRLARGKVISVTVLRTAGACLLWRSARRSSTRWFTPTTRSAVPHCACPSSTTGSRSRIQACCRSASRSRIFPVACRSCATE